MDEHHPNVRKSAGEEEEVDGDSNIKMDHMKIRVYELGYNYT